jgi:hypothetical protein
VGVALAGAAVLTVSIGLATVAFASAGSRPITGSVIAMGSMPTGMGLAVHPGTNTIVGQYTFGPHSSTGVAQPPRQDARGRAVGDVHRLPRRLPRFYRLDLR